MSSESDTQSKENRPTEKHKEMLLDKICYQIKVEIPVLKCTRFYLMKDDEIIYMAKLKYDEIFIAEGDDFHIKKKHEKNVTQIKRNTRGYNEIITDNHDFKIKYSKDGQKFPMSVTFGYNGHKINWNPKDAEHSEFIKEGSDNIPKKSKKNFMLQNSYNLPTFILRKMSSRYYEVECFPTVDPVIVFSIALSGIIGPIAVQ